MMRYFLPLLLLISAQTHADNLISAVQSCKQISDDKLRLHCFDQIELSEQPAAVSAPVAAAQQPQAADPAQVVANFGQEHKMVSANEQQKSIVLKLTKLTTAPTGSAIFTFENGQVWRQVSTEYFFAEVGRSYELERGALNSFFLSEAGKRREIKVRRVK